MSHRMPDNCVGRFGREENSIWRQGRNPRSIILLPYHQKTTITIAKNTSTADKTR